jgi:hypothetical protein
LQPLAFVDQIVENKRIENEQIRGEKYNTTQVLTNPGQEPDKTFRKKNKPSRDETPRKKRKPISPQQKSDYEEMIINPPGGNDDDPMAGDLFAGQEEKTPRFMFEDIKDLSEENGENKEELEEDK